MLRVKNFEHNLTTYRLFGQEDAKTLHVNSAIYSWIDIFSWMSKCDIQYEYVGEI